MGNDLIDFVNDPEKYATKQAKKSTAVESSDDPDWDWWLSLEPATKFMLLHTVYNNLEEHYGEDEKGIIPVFYDSNLYNDRNGYIYSLLKTELINEKELDINWG
ncbi:hypothetical protein A4G20_05190 [Pasteurellaceae bacterium RH1A]|nr:hypothetical protein A4G20_05190 [Pasteurellaceae bacterium RH1A]